MSRSHKSSRCLTLVAGCALGLLLVSACLVERAAPDQNFRRIPVDEYRDRVLASWLGQIIGNTYGLSYEFKFLDEPGPDAFPYGYGEMLDRVREVDGAFSDDDTDIEYMYLLQMERHGIEPTYEQLTEAWKHHIRTRIWAANRVALTLMHHGYEPPLTGDSLLNPRWFEIDPQLVNEIWAVTAPGMIDYAAGKTEWAARITNDSFGIEPAMHYGAMYSAAFFVSDVDSLIDIGTAALPDGSRFAGVVEEMKALHAMYPDDWQAARKELADKYFIRQPYNRFGWEPIDAILNGAAGILALLYGEGDIQLTLDLACAIGFDADNQAATMTGLLALAGGTDVLPEALLYPLDDVEWNAPFNDRYVNVTRHDMPDASLTDMAARIAEQGEAVILATGGRRVGDHYEIPVDARFIPPLELPALPPVFAAVGEELALDIFPHGDRDAVDWTLDGEVPGLRFDRGRLAGTPSEIGQYALRVSVNRGDAGAQESYTIHVRSENFAPLAERVLHNENTDGLNAIRDGSLTEPVFYSSTRSTPHRQWYGYEWADEVVVSRVGVHMGFPQEEWGWLVNPAIEFRDSTGGWTPVLELSIDPSFPKGETKYLQPGFVGYDFRFQTVRTNAIRLVGVAGGDPVDAPPMYGSAISELTVHSQ
ncbi:MAG: ADP-ribosylglycohydrolase family protein [Rhodothermales bacterium]|nr:ADP-ribosylglycohydrolase family protein [Rhodothermales bacterium]